MSGYFITFEGGEGSGKTTQIELLKKYLIQKNYPIQTTREPGGTSIGDQIRSILLDAKNSEMSTLTELYLYSASRNQHIEEKIKPWLKNQQIILCDRFTDATLAYQGYGRGIDLDLLAKLNSQATDGMIPHLTLLFDMDPLLGINRSLDRLNQTKKNESRFEVNEKIDFHQRVREGYLIIAKENPTRVKVIQADDTVENIHQKVIQILSSLLNHE